MRFFEKLVVAYFFWATLYINFNGGLRMDQFMICRSVATKVGDYNKTWDLPPAQTSNSHWTAIVTAIGWMDVHRKSVKVKVNTLMYGQSCHWHVESTSLLQQESQT